MEANLHNVTNEYILENAKLRVGICPLGATITKIIVKGTCCGDVDVALGYANVLQKGNEYFGATIGRCANRIKSGKFTLNGNTYRLNLNDSSNHLHGGVCGWDKRVFSVVSVQETAVELSYLSPDGEENYCGTVDFNVRFSIDGGALTIAYGAKTSADTLFNPTNHTYFNLNGQGDGSILDNVLQLNCGFYTPVDNGLIPTGEIAATIGEFDFTKPKQIGADIFTDNPQLKIAGGFDHNFCVKSNHAARACSPKTGIVMNVYTDRCGLQFYSGNFLKTAGKSVYNKYSGFCLETQCYPNAINLKNFGDSPVLLKGDTFNSTTSYVFSVKK